MKQDSLGYITNGVAIVFSALQENEIFSIVSWVLTLLATIITISYTLWKWWKKAKADGKIDDDEIEEGLKITKEGLDKLSQLGKEDEENGKKK